MKTTISIDGQLLEEADRAARRMGVSRSRLFSLALQEYLLQRRQEEMTEQLNRVYAGGLDAPERRTTAGMKARFRATMKDRW
jgi:metal-responsive CopG/Arc/MetJ family transcriptional regulator